MLSHAASLSYLTRTAGGRGLGAAVACHLQEASPTWRPWRGTVVRWFGAGSKSGEAVPPANVLVLDDDEGILAASSGVKVMQEHPRVRSVRVLGAGAKVHDLHDEELHDVHVLMALRERTTPIDAALLDRLPSLELLLQTGGHAYHLDDAAATARGIAVALGRGVQAPLAAVPEVVFALAVSALRHLPTAYSQLSAGTWPGLLGRCLAGRRLGLLGLGRHGSRVARIARMYGLDVVAWDRCADPEGRPVASMGTTPPCGYEPRPPREALAAVAAAGADDFNAPVPRVPMAELLATSDIVSIHLKLSDESRGLVSASHLAAMRPGAVLVNTARGAIVDEAALAAALADNEAPLAAAGLDVFTEEPLPPDSPLRSLPNAVLTPHLGYTVEEVFEEFADVAAGQLCRYLAGDLPTEQLLNPDAVGVAPAGGARKGGFLA